jgi:hypothetical protein
MMRSSFLFLFLLFGIDAFAPNVPTSFSSKLFSSVEAVIGTFALPTCCVCVECGSTKTASKEFSFS